MIYLSGTKDKNMNNVTELESDAGFEDILRLMGQRVEVSLANLLPIPTFLGCYNEWMKEGRLPKAGLCASLPEVLSDSEAFALVSPSYSERKKLAFECVPTNFWGCDLMWTFYNDEYERYTLTPRRQNILLLCAALNGEFDN